MVLARLVKACPDSQRLAPLSQAVISTIGYRCKLFEQIWNLHKKAEDSYEKLFVAFLSQNMLTDDIVTGRDCHVVRHRFFKRENFHVDTSSELADAFWLIIELTLSTILLKK